MNPTRLRSRILHGVSLGKIRATLDLDILIEVTPDNAQRLLNALLEANMGTDALTTAEELLILSKPGILILPAMLRASMI